MDYTYFQNENGKFTAKKLPTPKSSTIKIKDESDLDLLREDLRDYKPKTLQEFKKIYEDNFKRPYDYDVYVESFYDCMRANRNKLLGQDAWIKVYWNELYTFIGDFEVGEPELEEEPQIVEEPFAKVLVKAGVAERVNEFEFDEWEQTLNRFKLPEIKEKCKSLGIKITKKNKDNLIDDLIVYESSHPGTLDKPCIVKALPEFETKITSLYELYRNEIALALEEHDYPDSFKYAVWEYAADEHEGEINDILSDELEKLKALIPELDNDEIEETISTSTSPLVIKISTDSIDISSKPQTKVSSKKSEYKLLKPLKVAFKYKDSKGDSTFRDFRLDKVVDDGLQAYFEGWCYLRNATRTFRTDRIDGRIIHADTGEALNMKEFNNTYLANFLSINDKPKIFSKEPSKSGFQQESTGCLVAVVGLLTLIGAPIVYVANII